MAVDVGHFHGEPGVISASGIPEFEFNLKLALQTKKELEERGLAVRMIGENRPFADERNGVHFYDNLGVGKTALMPSVLVEAGVIVNRKEEVRMLDPQVRALVARSIAQGAAACLR